MSNVRSKGIKYALRHFSLSLPTYLPILTYVGTLLYPLSKRNKLHLLLTKATFCFLSSFSSFKGLGWHLPGVILCTLKQFVVTYYCRYIHTQGDPHIFVGTQIPPHSCSPAWRRPRASCCRSGTWSAWCRCGWRRCGGSWVGWPSGRPPKGGGLKEREREVKIKLVN